MQNFCFNYSIIRIVNLDSLLNSVTKLVSTKMSEGYGKATDVLYWLSIFYKPSYPLLLLF